MPNNYFRFKQFTVHQDGAAMKVGTDGVIIGAWSNLSGNERRILDIGAGTGLIALMAAQRTSSAQIDAVEIDESSASQALINVKASGWADRVKIYNLSIQEFAEGKESCYDHIISNPPYFIGSLECEGEGRTRARHTGDLSYEDLIAAVVKLLEPDGVFSAIFPYKEASIFIALAAVEGLYCVRRTDITGVAGGPVKRAALEFSLDRRPLEQDSLVIEKGERGDYSDQYKKLTKDFYLKF